MIFSKTIDPKFRETDADGKVGVRGYFEYFQDVATHAVFEYGLNNIDLPKTKGVAWIYTKYKMKIFDKVGFAPVNVRTWVEPLTSSLLTNRDMVIMQGETKLCEAKLESCLIDVNTHRLTRLSAVDMPDEMFEDKKISVEAFSRFDKNLDGMEYVYTHMVQYTDLDNLEHMTNLRYVNLILNAFDGEWHKQNRVTDFEIHYINQCFEGDEIRVLKKEHEGGWLVYGVREDNQIAMCGEIKFEKI